MKKFLCLLLICILGFAGCSVIENEGYIRYAGIVETDPVSLEPLISVKQGEQPLLQEDARTLSKIFNGYRRTDVLLDLWCSYRITLGNTEYKFEPMPREKQGYVEVNGKSFLLKEDDLAAVTEICERYTAA